MKFPEISYFLPALKDQRTQRLEYVSRTFQFGAMVANDNVSGALVTVPADRFFCIMAWGVRFAGVGAGDIMTTAGLYIAEQPGDIRYCDGQTAGVKLLGEPQHIGSSCEIWLPPNTVIRIVVAINNAGAHNCVASLWGAQVPRGNIVVA